MVRGLAPAHTGLSHGRVSGVGLSSTRFRCPEPFQGEQRSRRLSREVSLQTLSFARTGHPWRRATAPGPTAAIPGGPYWVGSGFPGIGWGAWWSEEQNTPRATWTSDQG